MNRASPMLQTGILLVALLLAACAGISGRGPQKPDDAARTAERAEARDLAAALHQRNRSLLSFRGIGRITLRQGERLFSSRVAWVGIYPDKLRLAVLNTVGQPMLSFAADGESVYLLSHADGKFYQTSSANPTLQRLISIPISVSDTLSILSGRFPIREYDTAALTPDANNRRYILSLKKKWRRAAEKLYLDADKRMVLQDEIFRAPDELAYRAVFECEHVVDDFRLPARITISDAAENSFKLDIERFWADAPQAPSTFRLTPP